MITGIFIGSLVGAVVVFAIQYVRDEARDRREWRYEQLRRRAGRK